MNTKEFLKVLPEELAYNQFRELKKEAILKLEYIISLLEKDDLQYLCHIIASSPTGDCISFYDETGLEDIREVTEKLIRLANVAKVLNATE